MKKTIYSLLLIFCSITIAQAGGDPVKKFYRKYKKRDQVFNIALPGILTQTSVGIARLFTRDKEARAVLKLARKMKGVRVLVDKTQQVPNSAARSLMNDLRAQGKMETLMVSRENGEQTWVMGNIKGDKVKKIVVVVFANDQFTMVAAKSRMKVKDVNRLIKVLQKNEEQEKERGVVKIEPTT